jgi:hypothetical protein
MALSEECADRLYNWKFEQALDYLGGATSGERQLVEALSATFGNSGWFGGSLGIIINAALRTLMPEEEDRQP